MSHTEETQKPTQKPEAVNETVANLDDEIHIVDAMRPTAAPTSNNKPLRYGTRRSKAGENAPVIKNLSSVSSFEEEEEIEMDDLPIRANVPEELIETRRNPSESREEYGEDRPRRNDRSRPERPERRERQPRERREPREPREPRAREPREERTPASPETTNETEAAAPAPDRPERFGTVKRPAAAGAGEVQEFRPTRDGRTAPKREPRSDSATPRSTPPKAKKKGLLARIIGFFTGDNKEEEKKRQERNNRDGQRQRGGRGRRGPDNRENRDGEREGGEGGENRRRRRPRNRKPRQDGESGPRTENGPRGEGRPRGERQNREGGEERRPRRPRRPRREGEDRREGGERRPRQESSSE